MELWGAAGVCADAAGRLYMSVVCVCVCVCTRPRSSGGQLVYVRMALLYTCICAYVLSTRFYTYIHTYIHTYINRRVLMYFRRAFTHTYMHTYIHEYTHEASQDYANPLPF